MPLARAALAAVLLAASTSILAAPCAGFTDVDDSSGFCVNVEWMKNRGITFGLTATQYDPNGPVTRLQMAAFMYRLGFQNAFLNGGNAFAAAAKLGTTDNQAVEVLANNLRAIRVEPDHLSPNVLMGHWTAGVYTGVHGATIAGGGSNETSSFCTTGFGCVNGVTDHFGTVGGGESNKAGDLDGNVGTATHATVGGGFNNAARGTGSTVAGGIYNTASGYASFAAGNTANAVHSGCIVLGDFSTSNVVSCGAPNQLIARALGGVYFFTGGTNDTNYTGTYLPTGSSAWTVYSDRNGKNEIAAVDPEEVLRKVVAMAVATWQWNAEPDKVRHMGPMAQDFHAAFGLGASEKGIATVDADGVALAAIQGLNAKLEAERAAKDAEIAALRAELSELRVMRAELATIRSTLASITGNRTTKTAELVP